MRDHTISDEMSCLEMLFQFSGMRGSNFLLAANLLKKTLLCIAFRQYLTEIYVSCKQKK